MDSQQRIKSINILISNLFVCIEWKHHQIEYQAIENIAKLSCVSHSDLSARQNVKIEEPLNTVIDLCAHDHNPVKIIQNLIRLW